MELTCGFSCLFPGLTSILLTLRCWFYFPLLREVLLFAGMSASSKENIDSLLAAPDGAPKTGKVGFRIRRMWNDLNYVQFPHTLCLAGCQPPSDRTEGVDNERVH
jgi:hypothetical protein